MTNKRLIFSTKNAEITDEWLTKLNELALKYAV